MRLWLTMSEWVAVAIGAAWLISFWLRQFASVWIGESTSDSRHHCVSRFY
jgi:hypothetical protein